MSTARNDKRQHEEFDIQAERFGKRKKLVRQDRFEVEGHECYVEIDGEKFNVINYSPFGLAIESEYVFQAKEYIHIPFIFQNVEVGSLHLNVVRGENIAQDKFNIAFEVIGEPIKTERIEAIKDTFQVLQKNESFIHEYANVPSNFKKLVLEAKDWLENIQELVNGMTEKHHFTASYELAEFEETVCDIVGEYFKNSFSHFYALFEDELKDLDEETTKLCFSYFRSKLNQLLHHSLFAERSFNKPLGYAGDFEMMNIIYRSEYFGKDLFSKAIHRYFVHEPAAMAVKNRGVYLAKNIADYIKENKGKKIKFLSIASGPAMEIQLIMNNPEMRPYLEGIEFHFIDQDLNSLKHAQRKLNEIKNQHELSCGIHFHNLAIKNIIAEGIMYDDFDFIYSAGLFDYFTNPVARMASEKMVEAVKPGGTCVIGNFGLDNPDHVAMTMALDWNLIYRSENDLLKLFGNLGKSIRVEQEQEGVNLFAKISV